MSYRKKFRIPKLKPNRLFADSQKPVIAHYLNRVLRHCDRYQKNESAENLHNLRIALRRFRYVLELYAATMKPARFTEVYEISVNLQNILGDRRDVDVMHARLLSIYTIAGSELPALITADLEQSKALLNTQIEKTLAEFVRHKQIQKLADD
jgi:CHAD domain-containing protein